VDSRRWDELWEAAYYQLCQDSSVEWVAALPQRKWFEQLLQRSGFSHCHGVVMLEWQSQRMEVLAAHSEVLIRSMNWEDIPEVSQIDRQSFPPLWQNSQDSLELAFRQAASGTVAQTADRIVGYQITTLTPVGAHLARLAVLPEMHHTGIGTALVQDVQYSLHRRGVRVLTVNTQENNPASLALYQKLGFRLTGEAFQVYGIHLNEQRQY
jgi:ribosomal protein S18 acetylase RimI-like enzyme